MAAHASFTAVDNVAANHVFTRVDLDGSAVRFQERTGSSSLSWKNWFSFLRPPVPGNGAKVYKVTEKFSMPIVVDETINGILSPKKVREYTAEVVFSIPAEGTDAERQLFAATFTSGLSTATVKDNIVNLLPLNGP